MDGASGACRAVTSIFDFTHAIVRRPAASVVLGLRDGDGPDPDFEGVEAEHVAYVAALRDAGLHIDLLEPLEAFPDSVFVEDVALVFGAGAILLNPGADSRRGEVAHIVPVLERHFGKVASMNRGFADGGDVLVMADRVVIGLSARTDREGAEAVVDLLAQLGQRGVVAETPKGVLHFKTGCSMIDEDTVLAVPAMAGCPEFKGLRVIETPPGEEAAANLLRVRDRILIGSRFPKIQALIEALGIRTVSLPVSEVAKIDAGLSCMSLRWSA
jgi:dimethylargininase